MSDRPEPMTPADSDLRGLPFMPLDIVRLFDSDIYALSTGEEFKAALTLWGKAWLQVPSASLPNDERILAHLSGAGARWKKMRTMALRGFVLCSDNRLYHPVIAEKANRAWERNHRHRHSIIRMRRPGRIKGTPWAKIRQRILARDNYCCCACGDSSSPLEIDHKFPIAEGGNNRDDNLQVLCRPCNRRKSFKVCGGVA